MRICLAAIATLTGGLAPLLSAAADATIDRPNQYPSPTVQVPADDEFDDDYPWHENKLLGDWRGRRNDLACHGLVIGGRYTAVMMTNTTGGFDTGFVGGGPLGITVTADTERLLGLSGGKVFFDWEFYNWYNGRFPPDGQFDPTGSYVGVNTNFIEADVDKLHQVAQLYYQQTLLDESLIVSFGKMDGNVPFSAVGAAGAFQNSMAMFTSTLNPFMPTYPNEATGLTFELDVTESLTGKFGWFDGTTAAFDPATNTSGPSTGSRGLSTFFDNDGHWFLITEWSLNWQLDETRPGSVGVGAWIQTGRTSTSGSNTQGVQDVPGWYVQWQQTLRAPNETIAADGGGVQFFGQFGWSTPSKNPVHWSLMTGVSATGVIECRPADALGVMFGYSHFTDNVGVYQSEQRDGSAGSTGGNEISLEAFYLWQWSSWSYAQPGLMWIANPGGGDPAPLDDVVLPYLLIGVEF